MTTHPEFNEEKCSRWSLVVEIFKTAFTFGKLVVNLPNIDCLQEIWLVETGATMKDYKLAVVPREEDLSRWTTHRYGRINACDTENNSSSRYRGEVRVRWGDVFATHCWFCFCSLLEKGWELDESKFWSGNAATLPRWPQLGQRRLVKVVTGRSERFHSEETRTADVLGRSRNNTVEVTWLTLDLRHFGSKTETQNTKVWV